MTNRLKIALAARQSAEMAANTLAQFSGNDWEDISILEMAAQLLEQSANRVKLLQHHTQTGGPNDDRQSSTEAETTSEEVSEQSPRGQGES